MHYIYLIVVQILYRNEKRLIHNGESSSDSEELSHHGKIFCSIQSPSGSKHVSSKVFDPIGSSCILFYKKMNQ
jgi:hypothetical protein